MNPHQGSPEFSQEELAEVIARGKRVKLLRGMLGLNKIEMAEKLGYSRASLSVWETATSGGLTLPGAKKLIKLAKEHGIHCDLAWLMMGVGTLPSFQDQMSVLKILPTKEETAILRMPEIQLFTETFNQAVVTEINDNSMEPYYSKGIIVGGIWQKPIYPIQGSYNGIVEIERQLQVRRIRQNSLHESIDVYFTTHDPDQKQAHEINDLDLDKIARIIRLWDFLN